MNYIYFFVYALYTVTKRPRKQDHSTVCKTIKVSANNPSNQVTIISTAPYLRDNKLDPYEWKEQPLVTESQPVLLLLIVHQES